MSIGEAIEAYLQEYNLKEKSQMEKLISDWPRIMGKPIAENTERLWYSEGVFHLKISHPMWKQELLMARTNIKQMLNKELGQDLITEVRIH
jgi:predicted nucleic acid-binding Zn ribbon protein